MDTRLHCVYLLTSHDPTLDGHYCYIGYTVNPLRRLRQHNGELVAGAKRTARKGRPWGIVCFISGFSEDRSGLKFEWCWQHPTDSTLLKARAEVLRGLSIPRLSYYIGVLMLLLTSDLFKSMPLKLHTLDSERYDRAFATLSARITLKPSAMTTPSSASNQTVGADDSSRGNAANSRRAQQRVLDVPSFNVPAVGPLQSVRMSVDEVKVWLRSQAGGGGVGDGSDAEWESMSDVSGADDYLPTQRPAAGSPASSVRDSTSDLHASAMRNEDGSSIPLWDPSVRRQLEGVGLVACTLCGLPVTSDIGVCCPRYISSSSTPPPSSPSGVTVPSRNDPSWERACAFLAHIPCANLWFNHSHRLHREIDRDTVASAAAAENALEPARIVPTRAITCPICRQEELHWSQLIQDLKSRVKRKLMAATTAAQPTLRGRGGAQQTGRGLQRAFAPGPVGASTTGGSLPEVQTRGRKRARVPAHDDRGEDTPLQLSSNVHRTDDAGNGLVSVGTSLPLEGRAAEPPLTGPKAKSRSVSSEEWMNFA